MAVQGWVSLNRKIVEHWIWKDKPFSRAQAWIDLILMMNHKNEKIYFDGSMIEIKRGSTITSILKLSNKWGWSRAKTTRFLNLLESDGMVKRKSDNKKTTITIVNYKDYQDRRTTEKQQKSSRRTSDEHQTDTNNNDITMINNENKKGRVFSSPPGEMSPDELEALKAELRK